MRNGHWVASAVLVLSGVASLAGPARSADAPERPKDVGLFERTERRLIPVTVRIHALAPEYRSRAAHLTKDDFVLVVGPERVPADRFELDNFCPDVDEERPPEQPDSPAHLMLFVDHMGLEARDNAHAMLRNMIPRLAAEGYQLELVPGAPREWSSDVDRLLNDVDRLFDPSSTPAEPPDETPEDRIRSLLESNRVDEAIAVAREEERAAEPTFEGPVLQLARAISDMAALPMPKAMIYFADSGYFSRELIVDTAVQSGVAIYSVNAAGLAPYDPHVGLADDPGAATNADLLSLAEHTGGTLSYGHYKKSASDRVLKRVETDLRCFYVLSIDAAGLDQDRILGLRLKLRSELKGRLLARTIPDVEIASEKRQQAEAAAIALRSGQWPGVEPAGITLVPVAFGKSRVDALVQFTLGPESGASSMASAWDVGINYFGTSRVSGYGNLRVTSRSPKIVFEKRVRLPMGAYTLVGVGQEVDGHGVARGATVGAFTRPSRDAVEFLHPLDLMQRERGLFVSEDERPRGEDWSSLRFAMAHSDRAISLVASVCRGRDVEASLTIEKSLLLPDEELRFSSTNWPRDRNTPCLVEKEELVAAGRLPWANRPYEATFVVSVHDPSGKTVATTSKAFWIIGPAH